MLHNGRNAQIRISQVCELVQSPAKQQEQHCKMKSKFTSGERDYQR